MRLSAITKPKLALPRPVRRFSSGAAWFFILVSLAHLAWVLGLKINSPDGMVSLYQTDSGENIYRAWGLTYDGWFGIVQAVAQGSVVVLAAAATLLPITRPRRIGHGILVTWAGWWAANLIWLASADGQVDSAAQASLLTFLFGCTVVRAASNWTPRSRQTPLPPVETLEPAEEHATPDPFMPAPFDADTEPDVESVPTPDQSPARLARLQREGRQAMTLFGSMGRNTFAWLQRQWPRLAGWLQSAWRGTRRVTAGGLDRVARSSDHLARRVATGTPATATHKSTNA